MKRTHNNVKQVKIQVKGKSKKNFYFIIMDYIKDNQKLPTDTYSKQQINYYLKTLKARGIVYKIGYGVWHIDEEKYKEYRFSSHQTSKNLSYVGQTFSSKDLKNPLKKIRGHGFCFKLPIKLKNWNNREKYLQKHNIPYKQIKQGQRIKVKNNKVWLCNNSIVIYFNKDLNFIDYTARESKIRAINYMKSLIVSVENMLNIELQQSQGYNFKLSRHHYAIMRNIIAEESNKKGGLMAFDKQGKLWLLTDNSKNLTELETVSTKTADIDNETIIAWFNGCKNIREVSGKNITPLDLIKRDQEMQTKIKELENRLNEMLYFAPPELSSRDSYFG